MTRTRLFAVLLPLLSLISATAVAQTTPQSQSSPYRFMVMGDPQFHVTAPGDQAVVDGYGWRSKTWAGMPRLCERLGASFFFVCGDLFEYKKDDGSNTPAMWDHWDKYTSQFTKARAEWVTGGHEFWGGSPNDAQAIPIFRKRYPERIRSAISDNDNLFILFDDIHDPKSLDPNGLQWLEQTLSGSSHRRVFFLGHVPPRNTTAWWPDRKGAKPDEFRSKMARLLENRKITAAFFGHEHLESYIGDTGGFPMFGVGTNLPLLVEIQNDDVSYRWLKKPLVEDVLSQSSDALFDTPLRNWRIASIRAGRNITEPPAGIDPAAPLRLDDGGVVQFQQIATENGEVKLRSVTGVQLGGKVLAIGEIPPGGLWARHIRLRSGVPCHIYHNQEDLGSVAPITQRWNAWLVGRVRNQRNWVTLVLDVTDVNATFSFIPHTTP